MILEDCGMRPGDVCSALHGHAPGFFRLFDLEKELSSLFDGWKVDLRTPEDLSRHFRNGVVAKAEVQYAQE